MCNTDKVLWSPSPRKTASQLNKQSQCGQWMCSIWPSRGFNFECFYLRMTIRFAKGCCWHTGRCKIFQFFQLVILFTPSQISDSSTPSPIHSTLNLTLFVPRLCFATVQSDYFTHVAPSILQSLSLFFL